MASKLGLGWEGWEKGRAHGRKGQILPSSGCLCFREIIRTASETGLLVSQSGQTWLLPGEGQDQRTLCMGDLCMTGTKMGPTDLGPSVKTFL